MKERIKKHPVGMKNNKTRRHREKELQQSIQEFFGKYGVETVNFGSHELKVEKQYIKKPKTK